MVSGCAWVSSAAMMARRGPVSLRDFSRRRSAGEGDGSGRGMATRAVDDFAESQGDCKERDRAEHNGRAARDIELVGKPDSEHSAEQADDEAIHNLLAEVEADVSCGGRRDNEERGYEDDSKQSNAQ